MRLVSLAFTLSVSLFTSSGCTGPSGLPIVGTGLTEAQACAVGYDLAREIHARVSLRRTVFIEPDRVNRCERHALTYLRRAGFRIAGHADVGVSFDVTVHPMGGGEVSAVADIGGSLRIARVYAPVRSGVIARSPVAIQELDPDSYTRRGDRW